jgi:hypothetical protein
MLRKFWIKSITVIDALGVLYLVPEKRSQEGGKRAVDSTSSKRAVGKGASGHYFQLANDSTSAPPLICHKVPTQKESIQLP